MDGPEHPDSDDQFDAQVSDTRSGVDSNPREGASSALAPRRPLRRRVGGIAALAAAALLALAVVVSTSPTLRAPVPGLLSGLRPTPTGTIVPGEDLFYLLPNPPGVDVSLDGKVLTHVPVSGDPHPLRLAPGRHVFALRSHLFPFQPHQCRITVPLETSGDTCTYVVGGSLPADIAHPLSRVIGMRESLATLPSREAGQLRAAIQAALDARRSTAPVQPGEWYYFFDNATNQGGPVQAQQPLRATLSYQLASGGGYPEPCVVDQPAIPCRFPGQDCTQLCTVAQPPVSLAGAGGEPAWIAGAAVGTMWDCMTLNGQSVGCNFGQFDLELAALSIQWDGSGWHVSAITGHTPGLDFADDAACDPARSALSNTSWGFMLTNPPSGARVQFASDATPTDGCVAVLDQAPGHDQPAVFLYRFSVLLTVNAAAVNPSDNLPVADVAEQALARSIGAQAQISF